MAPSGSQSTIQASASTDELAHRFLAAWRELACPPSWRRLLVAVSGGPDSLALLHLLHETRDVHRLELLVGHADHGIHPESGTVAAGVVRAADQLGIPTVVGRLALGPSASETVARAARQAWLEQTRRSEGADAVAFAHHRDDQVETILMRTLAGSGPAGLAGIAARTGVRVRPLLGFHKAELTAWLAARGVHGWSDPANADPAHLRSWVRQTLLPLLDERLPAAAEALLGLGRHAARNTLAWSEALETLPGLDLQQTAGRVSLAALPLVAHDPALAGVLLQAAARRVGCVLGVRRTADVLALMRRGTSGGRLDLGAGWCAELAFGRIGFYQVRAVPGPLRLTGTRGEARWGPWTVRWNRGPATRPTRRDGWSGWFIAEEVLLRAPGPGDRMVPWGGVGHRALVRLLQEARVERSRRAGWPVVEVNGHIEWLAGICRGGGALPQEATDGLRIEVSGG